MVVSSETPFTRAAAFENQRGLFLSVSAIVAKSAFCSADSGFAITDGSDSAATPRCRRSVASPPSSTMRSGPEPSGHVSACFVHHQYSSSVSPFHANTGTPDFAIAAAAASFVEKMLQLAQRTSAPSSRRVSMRIAVSTVMCSEPATRAPARGFFGPYFALTDMSPGISCSSSVIIRRPRSANLMSLTL